MNDDEVSVDLPPNPVSSKSLLGESLDGDDGREAFFERVSEVLMHFFKECVISDAYGLVM